MSYIETQRLVEQLIRERGEAQAKCKELEAACAKFRELLVELKPSFFCPPNRDDVLLLNVKINNVIGEIDAGVSFLAEMERKTKALQYAVENCFDCRGKGLITTAYDRTRVDRPPPIECPHCKPLRAALNPKEGA